jgi:hypothetical protein
MKLPLAVERRHLLAQSIDNQRGRGRRVSRGSRLPLRPSGGRRKKKDGGQAGKEQTPSVHIERIRRIFRRANIFLSKPMRRVPAQAALETIP